jgi:hypothetical protein
MILSAILTISPKMEQPTDGKLFDFQANGVPPSQMGRKPATSDDFVATSKWKVEIELTSIPGGVLA